MFFNRIRVPLIIFILGMAVFLHLKQGFGSAWFLYLSGLIILGTYFLFGNVWTAFALMRRGKIEEAERLLKAIKRPEWLYPQHRAYYYFTSGVIALQKKELKLSEDSLKKALTIGLRAPNDTALATLNLAHICFVENRLEESKNYLKKLKDTSTNDLMIKQHIKQLEEALGENESL